MRIEWMALPALMLAGCTPSAELAASDQARAARDLAAALKDRVPGTPVDCITPGMSDGPQIIDRDTVLYRQGARVFRNELASECPALSPMDTLIVEMRGSQLCRNDMFRVLRPGSTIPSAYCRFGKFTPYTRP